MDVKCEREIPEFEVWLDGMRFDSAAQGRYRVAAFKVDDAAGRLVCFVLDGEGHLIERDGDLLTCALYGHVQLRRILHSSVFIARPWGKP